jgi:multidrug resistance efflux pump
MNTASYWQAMCESARKERDAAQAEVKRLYGEYAGQFADLRLELARTKRARDFYAAAQPPQFTDIAWQGCLDRANKNAAEARAERDEARASLEKLMGQPSPADNEVLLALARHINRVCFKG